MSFFSVPKTICPLACFNAVVVVCILKGARQLQLSIGDFLHCCMFHIFRQLWGERSSQSVLRYLRQYIMRTAFVLWRRDWNHLICAPGFWASCTRTARYFPFLCQVTLATATFFFPANCGGWKTSWNLKKHFPSPDSPSHFLHPLPLLYLPMKCIAKQHASSEVLAALGRPQVLTSYKF